MPSSASRTTASGSLMSFFTALPLLVGGRGQRNLSAVTVDPETRVCPFCGSAPGPGVFGERCGRNLSAVERLPMEGELPGETTDGQLGVRAFLEEMRAAGNPGTVELDSGKPRAFRRTPRLTGWIVVPVDREDVATPHRYAPGL